MSAKTPPTIPELVKIPETMTLLAIGRTKTYELINAGVLEAVKFGKRTTRVRRSSINKLIANGIA